MRYLCVHGHFYQPPRENPYLEAVELQDSAYPYHDWNERVASECYTPNAKSRILDGEQRIVELVNNYGRISFNFGPTLLSWIAEKAAKTYEALREADKSSRERFSGHGSAIAQAYNHMIMPLANCRDKITQVKWGECAILNTGLAGSRKECGYRRQRSTLRRWTCWPQTGSSSRYLRRGKQSAFASAAADRGRMSAAIAWIRAARTWCNCRRERR